MLGFPKICASRAAKIFVVSVCIVISMLEIWSAVRERAVELEESNRATSNVAMALAQHADQTFSEVDIVLLGLIERLENDGYSERALTRTHNLMVMHVGGLPQLAGLFVYDEKGKWIVNSQPVLEQHFNNADRDYFIYHRDHRTEKPFIGKPIRSKSNGQWILTISRRINKIDGSFGGVVLGTIDLAYFQRFYEQFNIGSNGAIMLGTLDGTVLHRRPLLSNSIGKSLGSSPLFQQYVKYQKSGSVEIPSTQDGVVRINSFQRLAEHPLFIIVALAKDEVLLDWVRHAWLRALCVIFLLLSLCYGGSRMVAQVRRREQAELTALKSKRHIEELYAALEEQSKKDGLTAVFNRRYFDEMLSVELTRASRSGSTLTLLMVDVDHFKQFNDNYGHAAGDVCLQQVATAIQGAVGRKGDIVARYGGEEFALILSDCDEAGAATVAAAIMDNLRNQQIKHAHSHTGIVTSSIGGASISFASHCTMTSREMIEIADRRLYEAKDRGRDQAILRHSSKSRERECSAQEEELHTVA